jgi:CRP-like cAMP-binding protein
LWQREKNHESCESCIPVAKPLTSQLAIPRGAVFSIDPQRDQLNSAPDKITPFNPQNFLSALKSKRTNLQFSAGAKLYAQGDPADAVYFLLTGLAKIVTITPAGKEAVLAILGPNNFFGDSFLAGVSLRRVTVTAIEATSAIRLEASVFKGLLRDEPQFSEYYIAYLIGRKIRTEFSLLDHLIHSSEKRLARALLQLTDHGEGDDPNLGSIKISQNTLADIVGTTRSRISFFMNKFRRAGFIEYKNRLRVHRSRLASMLEDG